VTVRPSSQHGQDNAPGDRPFGLHSPQVFWLPPAKLHLHGRGRFGLAHRIFHGPLAPIERRPRNEPAVVLHVAVPSARERCVHVLTSHRVLDQHEGPVDGPALRLMDGCGVPVGQIRRGVLEGDAKPLVVVGDDVKGGIPSTRTTVPRVPLRMPSS